MSQEESRKPKFQIFQFLIVVLVAGLISCGLAFLRLRHLANENIARADSHQLKGAIANFFTEYQRYPFRDPAEKFERVVLSDREIMGVLLGAEKYSQPDGINPRGISFCEFRDAKPIRKGKYRGGMVIDSGGDGELWDPWGNHYRIIIGTDFENQSAVPSWVQQGVIVWSPGPDSDDETAEDNIITW